MEPFMGQITMFGFNFAPRGWAQCQGQLLQISQYNALFALLGTFYGGDGRSTFALPDLRGRAPVSVGTGPGLPPRQIGEHFGSPAVTLTEANMPSHTHAATVHVTEKAADLAVPTNNRIALGVSSDGSHIKGYTAATTPDATLASSSVVNANAGGSQGFSVDQPSLTLNFCVALEGMFPSRN